MLSRDVVEGGRGDVVGLALADEAVVLEQILLLGWVDVLSLEDSLGLAPRGWFWSTMPPYSRRWHLGEGAYSEMFSNSIFWPNALLAAVASSSPAQSMGPVTTIIWPRCLSSKPWGPFPERTWAATWATSCHILQQIGPISSVRENLHPAPPAQTCATPQSAAEARPRSSPAQNRAANSRHRIPPCNPHQHHSHFSPPEAEILTESHKANAPTRSPYPPYSPTPPPRYQ